MTNPAALRAVIDTNVWISGIILNQSHAGKIIKAAFDKDFIFLADVRLIAEIVTTIRRPKFNRYADISLREEACLKIADMCEYVPLVLQVDTCRDPNDNMILEIALNGEANYIISGDDDLLTLHPFRGIPIISPAEFLKQFS